MAGSLFSLHASSADSSQDHRCGTAPWRWTLLAGLCALVTACGGGGDANDPTAPSAVAEGAGVAESGAAPTTSTGSTDSGSTDTGISTPEAQALASATKPTRAEVFRLLTQASFGPSEVDLARAMNLGTAAWVDEQLAKPARAAHAARWSSDNVAALTTNPNGGANGASVVSSFYQAALQNDDQLRQRVAYALSQIFVVSLTDLSGNRSQSAAGWLDMLNRDALGNFRTLLDDVALNPAMGQFLSHLGNTKEDTRTGRTPDQNFGRELMQLFTIGLLQLNLDGTPVLDARGRAIETYGTQDIVGMSAVFTGYSWAGTNPKASGPYVDGNTFVADRMVKPMQAYPKQHSTSEKRILGKVIGASSTVDMAGDRRIALDTLFNHPNVGPFISRQLIQRLVISQPSAAYVQRVAKVFNNNGAGVRGDLKAVVRAILLDDEARSASKALGDAYGKLREPVLRLTALLRAYPTRSLSGKVLIAFNDDPGTTIGQLPLNAPSVFNFYRPGYVPPGGEAAQRAMTLPEMQTTTETSVAGYANAMLAVLSNGTGQKVNVVNNGTTTSKFDLQTDYAADLALATSPDALARKVCDRLLTGSPSAALIADISAAISSIAIPAANANNADKVANAKLNRVRAALLLALVSPEFIVQK